MKTVINNDLKRFVAIHNIVTMQHQNHNEYYRGDASTDLARHTKLDPSSEQNGLPEIPAHVGIIGIEGLFANVGVC